ncbi:MAG: response regulator [Selenomonadaceae bacterium]|nr:response regulator [Selenomonadaceae bacterium]
MGRNNFLGKKYLYEVLPMLKWVAEQVPGGFFVYSAKEPYELFYANSEVLDIYACENLDEFKELTGYTFKGMVHPDDFDAIQQSIEEQIADPENDHLDHVEYRITRKDGEIRWIDDYGHFATFPEHGDAFYVFISDITERRQIQEEKLRMEMELDKERQANEIKAAFLFNISHDILTPLNSIRGFTELARRHLNEPELLKTYLEKVDESSLQMLNLVNDLLDMSKITYGKTQLRNEVCDLEEQVLVVVHAFKQRAEEKNISFESVINLPREMVYTDDVNLRKILSSLVDNAIKFTPLGGHVKLTAKKKKVSDAGYLRCEFTVSDDGVGMTPEFMRKMYETFEREETSTKTGHISAGLGLAITKKLIDAMGGSIEAVSEKGKGTTFTVGLPFKIYREEDETTAEAPIEKINAEDNYGHRILLVDDIELNRMLAETILEESGFSVETVADGVEAVEVFVKHPPGYYDLVLMDIQMPIMNGYEATRAIRALDRPDAKVLPIIALSANSRDEDKRMSMESGMNYHIAKPFDVVQLIAAVNKYIAARKEI